MELKAYIFLFFKVLFLFNIFKCDAQFLLESNDVINDDGTIFNIENPKKNQNQNENNNKNIDVIIKNNEYNNLPQPIQKYEGCSESFPTKTQSLNPTHEPVAINPTISIPTSDPVVHQLHILILETQHEIITPSLSPSSSPSTNPHVLPSPSPSVNPSLNPTHKSIDINPTIPIPTPDSSPSDNPSPSPSLIPSLNPSPSPSSNPTSNPSTSASSSPSSNPSSPPSLIPISPPSDSPSLNPVILPSLACWRQNVKMYKNSKNGKKKKRCFGYME